MNQFVYPMRIHIEDTDFTGLVYHSNYLNFMERARSEWFAQLGLGISWQREHHLTFVIHSAQIKYIKPAKLHDLVEVVSTMTQMRSASMVFEQYLRLAQPDHRILCKAEIKLACLDAAMRPAPYPHVPVLETIRRSIT